MNQPLSDDGAHPERQPGATDGGKVIAPIWLKILAALVVPLVVVAGLAWMQVNQANSRVQKIDDETALASVASSPGGLVNGLIVERGDALVTMLGIRGTAVFPTKNFDESMAETDKSIATLKAAVDKGGAKAAAVFSETLRILEVNLPDVRKSVLAAEKDAGLQQWDPSGAAYESYTEVIDALNRSNASLVSKISDPELRAAGDTLNDVNAMHDAISNLNLFIGRSLMSPNDKSARDNVAVSLASFTQVRTSLASRVDGPWAAATRAFQANHAYEQMEIRAQDFLATNKIDLNAFIGLNPPVADKTKAPAGTTQHLANVATKALEDQIDHLRSQARAERQRYTLLGLGVVIGAALLAALMARSVSRPLRRLTAEARRMATLELPAAVKQVLETPPGQDVVVPDLDPIRIKSHDEVQSVAAALNQVQTSALGLAVEQATLRRNIADSFVSLGRRTQNLIALQLEQITQLEEDEADPATLESLYRLDHLATRARRNAESLVVLGGTSTAQRTGGAPLSMTDVVRAALSEVEDYQRVEIVKVDEATIPAAVAADLIHLLAELTENGLIFSPPHTTVDLRGERTKTAYRITVEDRGVGMTDEKIQEANIRLAARESFTVAPSRYLGHYVAGRLAARIGAVVALHRGDGSGIIAVVDLPLSLLVDGTPTAPGFGIGALGGPSAAVSAEATDTANVSPLRPAPEPATPEDPARPVEAPAASPFTAPAASAALAGTATPSAGADSEAEAAAAAGDEGLDGFKTDGRPPVAPTPVTSSGLRKRVPGQQIRPGQITAPTIPRNREAQAVPPATEQPRAPEIPAAPAAATPERTPTVDTEGVSDAVAELFGSRPTTDAPPQSSLASLLSAYTSGVEQGRTEVVSGHGTGDDDPFTDETAEDLDAERTP